MRFPIDFVPEESQVREAAEKCVGNDLLLLRYLGFCADQLIATPSDILQMIFAGLPREYDKSPRADALRDKYEQAKDGFLSGFRAWLEEECADALQDVIDKVIESDAEYSRYEARAGGA